MIRYVETTRADIELADRLASQVLGRSLDELPPGTRRLLDAIAGYVARRCQAEGLDRDLVRFTRRQLREALPFGDTQLKVHLARLADYELVIAHRTASGGYCYELAWQPPADGHDGADTAATLDRSGSGVIRSALGRPAVGAWPGGGRAVSVPVNGQASGHGRVASPDDHAGSADPGQGSRLVIAAAGGAR